MKQTLKENQEKVFKKQKWFQILEKLDCVKPISRGSVESTMKEIKISDCTVEKL